MRCIITSSYNAHYVATISRENVYCYIMLSSIVTAHAMCIDVYFDTIWVTPYSCNTQVTY